ncbi:hypothetical protein E2C01_031517 [Portunus trituberculatus]|uniref:Uncharacterized protein n=1 Tax=Portunus trituberculatus TaxID=210409 RepID=A0A5B7EYC3_PORTR|nr:hypothetical protein [Portunus trituberculatus]
MNLEHLVCPEGLADQVDLAVQYCTSSYTNSYSKYTPSPEDHSRSHHHLHLGVLEVLEVQVLLFHLSLQVLRVQEVLAGLVLPKD